MPPSTSLTSARELAKAGLQVLPAGYRDKAPIVSWKKYQDRRTEGLLAQWFGSRPLNFWIMTGHMSGVVVLDIDSDEAERYWRDERDLSEILDRTTCVKTSKGHHYYFRVSPDDRVASWSVHPTQEQPDLPSFDVRAEGTGVIAPPSVHESGLVYEWIRTLEHAQPLPEALRAGGLPGGGAAGKSGAAARAGGAGTGGDAPRSMLSRLLEKPPAAGGRNTWLSKVAGHYAKQFRGAEDAYLLHVRMANQMLSPPLDEAEFNKTIESIWQTEHTQHPERALSEDTGWLVSGDHVILTQIRRPDIVGGERKGWIYDVAQWADFDLQVTGVVENDNDDRVYTVALMRKRQRDTVEAVLPARILGDSKKMAGWLAGYGVAIIAPDDIYPKGGSPNARLLRYLDSQEAPTARMAHHLGWDDQAGGFLTFDGIIRTDGPHPHAGIRPNPILRTTHRAPFAYGFDGGESEAREVLREVLTFHEETTASVFGAWWAACLLKPQIEARTALFPFMAIESPSESGKTNGFFGLMTGLNGNVQGETQGTKASSRDAMSANRSGIVWIDDLDDPQFLHELLRVATSGGSLMKKGPDHTENVITRLVAPVVISGESLGLNQQKALLDRAVVLKAPSPVNRTSQHPERAGQPQWDDIVALRERYPDSSGGLSRVAGSLVAIALRASENRLAEALREAKQQTGMSGRAGDKAGILLAGARLLDAMVVDGRTKNAENRREAAWSGRGEHARRVLSWLTEGAQDAPLPGDNTLTLKILPWALRENRWPVNAIGGQPVFVEDVAARTLDDADTGLVLWFNAALLAQAWVQAQRGRIEQRTESETALLDQARAAGLFGTSKRFDIAKGRGGRKQIRYLQISGDLATRIMERSQA